MQQLFLIFFCKSGAALIRLLRRNRKLHSQTFNQSKLKVVIISQAAIVLQVNSNAIGIQLCFECSRFMYFKRRRILSNIHFRSTDIFFIILIIYSRFLLLFLSAQRRRKFIVREYNWRRKRKVTSFEPGILPKMAKVNHAK